MPTPAARRGRKRAAIATARHILEVAYHILSRREDYQERDRQALERRLVGKLHALGYEVSLQPTTPAA